MKITLLLLTTLAFFSTRAADSDKSPQTKTDKPFAIGMSQEVDTLHPMLSPMAAALYIFNMHGRPLVSQNRDMKLVPQLAESIPTLENKQARIVKINGASKIVADWKLREAAKWGDGVPVTCHDFQFAKAVSKSENVAIAIREPYERVESIECDSKKPKNLKITYRDTIWDFNRMVQFYVIPAHLEEAVFNTHAKTKLGYDSNSMYIKMPTNPGLYSGPYVVTELMVGSHISLAANPYFWGKPPKIKNITIKVIPNTGTLEANLYSGTIDMIGHIGVSLDQVLSIEENLEKSKKPFEVRFQEGLNYEHIDLNLDNEILKNLNVRRAMNYAVDKKTLTSSFFKNKKRPSLSFLCAKDPWYDSKKIKEHYAYSPKKANELLDLEGWKKSEDGYRYKNGKKLSLPFMTTSGSKTRETVQVYLVDQWKKVGIEVVPKNAPARVMFESVKKRDYPAMTMFAVSFMPEPVLMNLYHSKNIPVAATSWNGRNIPGWKNKKVDSLLEKMDTALKFSERKRLALEIAEQYMTDAPTVPMYCRLDTAVIPKNLRGFNLTGFQQLDSLEIENWSLE